VLKLFLSYFEPVLRILSMMIPTLRRVLPNRRLLYSILVVSVLATFGFSAVAQARSDRFARVNPQMGGHVVTDNLTVGEGEVYENDVTVLSGNVIIEPGGLIEGSLNVLAGNIEIRQGGEVEEDVSALSGNIRIGGLVGGDVAAMSGDIELTETAEVEGDVSIVSGKLTRAPGAEVGGDVVRGRGFPGPFSSWQGAPNDPTPPHAINQGPGFWSWLGWLILRLILAVILTAVAAAVAALFYNLRPDILRPIHALMVERTAYSFIVGLFVNVVLAMITGLLIFTVILCLGGLITGAILLALNLVGWSVVSHEVGNRLTRALRLSIQPVAATALGALVLTGVVALLWAFGGCFQPVAYLLWLLASSLGVGAAVVRWLRLDGRARLPAPPPVEPSAPSSPPATPPTPPAPDTGRTSNVAVYSTPTAASTSPPFEEALPPLATAPALDQPENPLATPAPTAEADFTVIKGIGVTLDRRLKAAGVYTFAQLAALPPEEIAAILGWSAQRVTNADLMGQARHFAGQ
jgi:predicted flap endonuclease-1-like 5' DNA nuclease/cytoskeletal protein CcmA (bactofilin family)